MQTKAILAILLTATLLLLGPATARADKSEVRIEAPDKATKGSEIVIQLNVSHHGNNLLHHTKWLRLDINGKTVQKWEFSATQRPEAENFSRTFNYTARSRSSLRRAATCTAARGRPRGRLSFSRNDGDRL